MEARPLPLSLHSGLAADVVLDELGIRSVDALLDALSTAMPGVADDTLAELRELFRFTQIRGVKTIRVRLYRDPVRTLETLAAMTAPALIEAATAHVALTGIAALPATPNEAAFTITAAADLVRVGR